MYRLSDPTAAVADVKIVVPVRLVPTPDQARALKATLKAVNDGANWASAVAFAHGLPREWVLREQTYAELKVRGLGAQAAQHAIKKVRDAYTALHANIRSGDLDKPGSKRRWNAESKPLRFRTNAAQPLDDRCLSWQLDAYTVSVWTIEGRMKGIAFTSSADHLNASRAHRKVCRDGVYLIATCEVPEADRNDSRNIAAHGETAWTAERQSRVPASLSG